MFDILLKIAQLVVLRARVFGAKQFVEEVHVKEGKVSPGWKLDKDRIAIGRWELKTRLYFV